MDLDHLFRDYIPLKYKKKDFIFMEGNTANFLYYIESGVIKTFKTTEKGKELVTGLNGADWCCTKNIYSRQKEIRRYSNVWIDIFALWFPNRELKKEKCKLVEIRKLLFMQFRIFLLDFFQFTF